VTIKLDVGCGYRKQQGFIGLDVRPTPQTDYVCSLQDTHNLFPYGTVDEIYSRRVIQHISDDVVAFKEVFRLLRVGGRATIIVAGYKAWLYYHLWRKHRCGSTYPCFHLYTKGRLKRKLKQLYSADYQVDCCIYTTTKECHAHSFDIVLKLFKVTES